MLCCDAVSFGFSVVPDAAEPADPFDYDSLLDPPPPLRLLSRSPSPQNVSANINTPRERIDFMDYASERVILKLGYSHRILSRMENRVRELQPNFCRYICLLLSSKKQFKT